MDCIDIVRDYSINNNLELYMVGGAVRDTLLGRVPSDIDFALMGDCHTTAREIANLVHGSYVNMHGDVARVVVGDVILDFTNYRGKSIEEDLKGRDFTINSIARDIGEGEYIDPCGGIEDIRLGIIRLTSHGALKDDPVRMLRAVRLSSRLGFKIEAETENKIMEESALLKETAGERILEELLKIFEGKDSHHYIELIDRLNLLDEIFPVMRVMKKIGQCGYHVVDAYTHSLLTLKFLENRIHEVYKAPMGEKVKSHLESEVNGRQRMCIVKLAAFLHDIGKPTAMQIEEGKVSFRGHEKTGEEELKAISSRLPFSANQRNILRDVIAGHMQVLGLFKQGASNKALFRFFRKFGENSMDVLLCSLCDVSATRSLLDENGEDESYWNFIMDLFNRYFEYEEKQNKKLVSGRDVIEILNLQGSEIGDILKRVDEEVFYGNIKTREEALNFIHRFRG